MQNFEVNQSDHRWSKSGCLTRDYIDPMSTLSFAQICVLTDRVELTWTRMGLGDAL